MVVVLAVTSLVLSIVVLRLRRKADSDERAPTLSIVFLCALAYPAYFGLNLVADKTTVEYEWWRLGRGDYGVHVQSPEEMENFVIKEILKDVAREKANDVAEVTVSGPEPLPIELRTPEWNAAENVEPLKITGKTNAYELFKKPFDLGNEHEEDNWLYSSDPSRVGVDPIRGTLTPVYSGFAVICAQKSAVEMMPRRCIRVEAVLP